MDYIVPTKSCIGNLWAVCVMVWSILTASLHNFPAPAQTFKKVLISSFEKRFSAVMSLPKKGLFTCLLTSLTLAGVVAMDTSTMCPDFEQLLIL